MQNQKSGAGRTAFVTGASTGIGAATALALARDGFDVAIAATRVGKLGETLAALGSTGARVIPFALDLRSDADTERVMADVIAALGRLDLLVNNAGVTIRRPALEVTRQEWDDVLGVNLAGTFFMCQQMGRHLVSGGRTGAIVNIASTHGVLGFPQRSTYGISKAGIIHLTRMLAYEWAEHGIRVNAIAPGTVETPSRAAMFAADPRAREAMTERVPLRRFATSEEVAAAVCYLAGPAAEYITGQTLLLDGGLTSY